MYIEVNNHLIFYNQYLWYLKLKKKKKKKEFLNIKCLPRSGNMYSVELLVKLIEIIATPSSLLH